MALLFMDGFDHWGISNYSKWDTPATSVARMVTGRWGAQAAGSWKFVAGFNLTKTLSANSSTLILGFAIFGPGNTPNTVFYVTFYDGSTAQFSLTFDSTWHPQFRLGGSGGTIVATAADAYVYNIWNYFEIKVAFAGGGAGTYELKINGTNVLSGSATTIVSANSYANKFAVVNNTDADTYIDDLYLANGTGSAPWNDFFGECRVSTQMPTSDSSVQFSRSTGASNYLCVDEIPPNDDTDYVYDATVGDKDLYGLTALSGLGTVMGVQVNVYHRKDDVGSREVRPVISSSGVLAYGDNAACASSYLFASSVFATDPSTSGQWALSGVNASKFGHQLVV